MTAHPITVARADGLSAQVARERLAEEGFNELPRPDRRTPLRIIIEVLREPMLALLLVGGLVYLALGSPKDALILLAFAMMSITITVVQETRTENVLEALRDLTSPHALVIRDGERQRIAGRDVVHGDIIVLSEGDRVPADAAVVESHDLQTDESLLTGESVPVRKLVGPVSADNRRPGGDDLPYLFSGSLVVRGTALAEVFATGIRSEIGRIGQSLNVLETEPPRLQAQMRTLVKWFALVGGIVSLAAVVLYVMFRGGWLDAILAGIAIGMSMLPEELPVVLTVFMAMGAWRISQVGVLTRRAAAIETLGSATVLCTDKTGTLTENRMSIASLSLMKGEVFRPAVGTRLSDAFEELTRYGLLASAPQAVDPMDKAFHTLGEEYTAGTDPDPISKLEFVRAYGLRPDCLAVTNVWKNATNENGYTVAAKGAPEAILALCRMDDSARIPVMAVVNRMAADGLRVLGIARATFPADPLPDSQNGFAFEFLGLAGLADPLRSSVPMAIKERRTAGIKVVMITGDYPVTARAIASEAGLGGDGIVTGEEIDALDDAALAKRVRGVTVFARVMPEQKLRIVAALKANGEIVAMTGDGVNDAPSLKAAHIGIAMGKRGTDVAREASSIVLLNDDFGSIVKSVRLGRRIYDNLRKAMGFIFAVHVPIAGLSLLPLLFGLPILFSPIHIAFLEMVIDPVCSLVFEAEPAEKDIMQRPPRPPEGPLFSRGLIIWSLVQGVLAFALVANIFVLSLRQGMPETEARALTFFSLVTTIFGLIFVNRSFSSSLIRAFQRPSRSLLVVIVLVPNMLALTLLWPAAAELFRFGPLDADDLLLTLGAGFLVLVVLELLKPLWRDQLRA